MMSDDTQQPFLDHLVAVLALLEVGHDAPDVEALHYDGPRSWQTDSILRSLGALARRVHTAEVSLHDLQTRRDLIDRPVKKRRTQADSEGESIRLGLAIYTSEISSPGGDHDDKQNHRQVDRPVLSDCINTSVADLGELPTPAPSPDVPALGASAASSPESPMILSPSPALTADIVYRPSFMTDDTSLTRMQALEVVRVCSAVASGDLSQKIIAPCARGGPLMGHLAIVLNDMVDSLRACAMELTSVLREYAQGKYCRQALVLQPSGDWHRLTVAANKLGSRLHKCSDAAELACGSI